MILYCRPEGRTVTDGSSALSFRKSMDAWLDAACDSLINMARVREMVKRGKRMEEEVMVAGGGFFCFYSAG